MTDTTLLSAPVRGVWFLDYLCQYLCRCAWSVYVGHTDALSLF